MPDQKRGPEPDAAGHPPERDDLAESAEGGGTSEGDRKVVPRMSVEEHLAGLWKMLGLGD
jgi:hypothetical protein